MKISIENALDIGCQKKLENENSELRKAVEFLEKRHVDSINDEQMRTFINQFEWIFAKTFARICPHEYIVKTKMDRTFWDTFENVVEHIRTAGFEAKYDARTGMYYILDDYYYWTMGEPISETTILNRAKISDYDLIENTWVWKNKDA